METEMPLTVTQILWVNIIMDTLRGDGHGIAAAAAPK